MTLYCSPYNFKPSLENLNHINLGEGLRRRRIEFKKCSFIFYRPLPWPPIRKLGRPNKKRLLFFFFWSRSPRNAVCVLWIHRTISIPVPWRIFRIGGLNEMVLQKSAVASSPRCATQNEWLFATMKEEGEKRFEKLRKNYSGRLVRGIWNSKIENFKSIWRIA